MRNKHVWLLFVYMMSITPAHSQELIVLRDKGGKPLSDFIAPDILDQISVQKRIENIQKIEHAAAIAKEEQEDPKMVEKKVLGSMFPIVSYTLNPIALQVDIERKNSSVINPLAVIGDDDFSKEWVESNADYFISTNTTLAIVEASSPDSIRYYKSRYPTLTLSVRVGDSLNRDYGVPGYPVLVTNQGIYQ
ncbi:MULTISPECIES: DUF2859 domain-containing protein [Vibrio]|uniref:DUF2859 domain-containing protein n=1 Tax=Vibrio TaxID=662 RepID=UPI001E3FD469|nr:DUF2859 domain-containing protein [Vibrio lentus]MCC4838035.1 DUF2859 domain-containing protein [Vibrio lentus]